MVSKHFLGLSSTRPLNYTSGPTCKKHLSLFVLGLLQILNIYLSDHIYVYYRGPKIIPSCNIGSGCN